MPNIKSAKKRVKVAKRNSDRNQALRSEMRTAIRAVKEAIVAKDAASANKYLAVAFKLLDKAVQKKVVHKNAAARHKRRLALRINAIAKAA